jgi:hypothetical protein
MILRFSHKITIIKPGKPNKQDSEHKMMVDPNYSLIEQLFNPSCGLSYEGIILYRDDTYTSLKLNESSKLKLIYNKSKSDDNITAISGRVHRFSSPSTSGNSIHKHPPTLPASSDNIIKSNSSDNFQILLR